MRKTNNSLLQVVCALKLSSLPLRQGICSMFESTQIRSDTLNGYVHLVPFVVTDEHFFLKTIIPSRKENRLQKPSTPTETP